MRILVTGGAGFIGSHLCDVLLQEGHEVWCLDNFMSGRKENVSQHFSNPNFHLIKHDVRKPLSWKKPLDRIYHLACPASPVYYQFDPIETLETAILGTREMLKVAEKTGARFLVTSTSEVYGNPLEHPQKETYFGNVDPLCSKACYEEGKRAAETLVKDFRERRGIDARIVRYFNVYGPRMLFHDGRVVSNFVRQALLGEDITIHGSGQQTRSFLYIEDALAALTGIMEKEGIFGPFNIGNPDERTIEGFADQILELTGSSSKKTFIPLEQLPNRTGDSRRRCPDVSRLKTTLPDWNHDTPLREGLKKTIADFQGRIDKKSRVIVFIPSFYPDMGPAENLVLETAKRMQDWKFDVITPQVSNDRNRVGQLGPVTIHRVGYGNAYDKYFLPFFGALKARRLAKEEPAHILWAAPASYGALAALLVNEFRFKRIPVFHSSFKASDRAAKGWRAWLSKLLFKKNDRWQNVDQKDMDLDEAANALRSIFQELEILGTKL